MIDLSFTSTKHGRTHGQKILHGYKRRRRFLDSFEGTRIGSRKLLLKTMDYDDVRCKYLDGPEYENIIQAFSRTNRLFGPDKPFGIIRYYRRPHTMEENIRKAIKFTIFSDKKLQIV